MPKYCYDKKYAVIIGIDKYKFEDVPNLQYAESDAKSIREKLVTKFKYKEEDIFELYGEEATKEKILNLFLELKKKVKYDDGIIFFFAGHGYSEDGLRKAVGYLIPYDGKLTNTYTMLQFDEIMNTSDTIKCKHIFFIIDACYSGLALQRGVSAKRFIKDMLSRQARQILTAGKGDQTVSDGNGPIANHSVFTGHLLNALDGDAKMDGGVISANSVMAYVYNKVSTDTLSYQTPNYGTVFGDGDYIFNDYIFEENDIEIKDDTLVTLPTTLLDIDLQKNIKLIDEMKELLSRPSNKIQIFDKVNKELRSVKTQLEIEGKLGLFGINDDNMEQSINKLNSIYSNLFIMIILICFWGNEEYKCIIRKIFEVMGNVDSPRSGTIAGLSLFYYPTRLMYYNGFISAIESGKYYFIEEMSNVEVLKSNLYKNERSLLIVEQDEKTTKYYNMFNQLNDKNNYYYPVSHYTFKYIQPLLDDLLFLDNRYEEKFIQAETLISIISAYGRYDDGNTYVWAQGGEFIIKNKFNNNYFLEFFEKDILEKIQLFKNEEDKNKFKELYLKMIKSFNERYF